VIDSESAYEILTEKLKEAAEKSTDNTTPVSGKPQPSTMEKIFNSNVARQVERTAASVITRSVLGALGLGGKSKKGSWF
jgi:hypothetical protein